MMIKIPDVVIGETRSISKEMEQYIYNQGGSTPASMVSDFRLFTVERVHFNFEKKTMTVAIRSISNPNLSGGYPAALIEACKVGE